MNSTLLVLPKPSRYDVTNCAILSGPARVLVDETLGEGTYDVCYAADFRADSPHSHVILTGQESLDRFIPGKNLTSTRGFVWHLGEKKLVTTFWPQDCLDLKDYETLTEDEEDDAGSSAKDDAPTKRSNYRFWLKRDCEKLYRTPVCRHNHSYCWLPNNSAAKHLIDARGKHLFFDLESHPDTDTLQCFSFALDDGPVYTCGVYDWAGRLVDGSIGLLAALARAFGQNKIIIHNAGFDLPFLALFHGVPFGADIEDTMLIGHRIWPEAEKSLAHVISLYTNEPYHKDQGGTWHPRNYQQYDTLLRYNAKDVHTLREVYAGQKLYIESAGVEGLCASVRQVNQSIFPYLYTSLHGLPVNTATLLNYRRARRASSIQWQRVVSTLAGYDLNPGSPQQVAAYFTDGLGYPVLAKTDSGAPSVDEGTLYKYLLRFSNPIIRFMLKYKRARKTAGELGFNIWTPIKNR